jgi:hypothetical protein
MSAFNVATVCGNCATAWDILYERVRSSASPTLFATHCKQGGCDPDLWDYCEGGSLEGKVPKFDNSRFHRRDTDVPTAWTFVKNKRTAPVRVFTPEEMRERELEERMSEKAAVDELEWDTAAGDDIEWV